MDITAGEYGYDVQALPASWLQMRCVKATPCRFPPIPRPQFTHAPAAAPKGQSMLNTSTITSGSKEWPSMVQSR
jgi:hypothetical protein